MTGAGKNTASDGFLDGLRGGSAAATDGGFRKAVDMNRKSRTWPKAASVDHVGDSGAGDSPPPPVATAEGTAAAEEGPTGPSGRGGLASNILGSGVWKKAYAAVANVTAATASATAAATAKAVNSDIAASATAVAASFGAGEGAGGRWAGPGEGGRSGSSSGEGGLVDSGRPRRRRSSRGGGGELVEDAERNEVDGGNREQKLGDEGNEEAGEAPPFLSISVGDVSCFLPDVHWSVQMHSKRFLKVGDSGSVK